MAGSPPVADASTTSVLSWYDARTPRILDLVGDYAGKELFLVEGDSLLRACFEDGRIDFEGGFQLLHAAFVVERFLDNLIKRHCNFHIAFFTNHKELCIPPGSSAQRSRYLLTRTLLIQHLEVHLPDTCGVEVHVFPSLGSDEFNTFLAHSPVYFVMAHDGSLPTEGKEVEEGAREKTAKVLLRGILASFNARKLNVALINQNEIRDSKIITMILEAEDHEQVEFDDEVAAAHKELDASKTSRNTFDIGKWLEDPSTLNELASEVEEDTPGSWIVGAVGASVILQQTQEYNFLASAYMLHLVILKRLSLEQRRFPLIRFEDEFDQKIDNFLELFSEVVTEIADNDAFVNVMEKLGVKSDLIDMIDGRLFRATVQALLTGPLKGGPPPSLSEDWSTVFDLVLSLSGKSLIGKAPKDRKIKDADAENNGKEVDATDSTVLSLTEPVFDKHLSAIHVDVDESLSAKLSAMKLYRESSYWQTHKPIVPKKHVPIEKEKVSKWKNPLRKNQFYMAEMTAYAASLTGSNGRVLEPETITVGAKKSKPAEVKAASKSGKASPASEDAGPVAKKGGGKKGGAGGLTKAQQIIAANKEKKGDAESDKAFSAWLGVMKVYDEILGEQERYNRAKLYRDGLDSARSVHVEADINMYLCQCLLNWWAKYCKADKKPEGYHVVALLWTVIRAISTSKSPVAKEIAQQTELIATIVGITDAITSTPPIASDKKLSFKFKLPADLKPLKISLNQTEFQLLHCGPYMDRDLDAKVDPRVSSFVPDGWQRKVLDELDADNSVFVVAPTSAGKTFISFYAMENILRSDNDGILIYVAPTKALVNQIAAEIQGRFSKKYPQAGKSIWAIHTREYRINNPIGCQILVTVPHILQTMLLSPTNAKTWSPLVRRIIFDEIHSIGTAEDGVVWEQLLLLAPCPIIALSATVGNPEQFSDWLAETQKSSGNKLSMIRHTTRYSDLRKFLYQPPKGFEFNGLTKSTKGGLGLDGLYGLSFLHPVASLQYRSRGLPDDLALEPRDCFILWKAMCKLQTENYKVPSDLDPAKALPLCIKKFDIFKWEKKLKVLLLSWMNDEKSPFEKLVQELTPTKTELAPIAEGEKEIDRNDLRQTTLPLLYQLHQRGALPAIFFNYDRTACEDIGLSILTQLKTAEDAFKESKEWKRKVEKWTEWKELKEKKAAKKAPKVSKKKTNDDEDKMSKADQARDDASGEVSAMDLFDPEEPQEDYSFADKRKCQRSEIDRFVKQLKWKNIKPELVELIQRGVGVHHSGMNKKYRQCVEILFRKGFLRVIIATGELSLGINMPCSTVVFSGDSVYLTALNFRQAAGRAGRRGFDLLGNVVFQNIDRNRACNLLSSRLPDLTGHFPITTDLILRLFTLLNESKHSPYATKSINGLLSQPRLYLGGKSFKEQVLYHLRFTIEYLRRQGLLGPKGEPVNFSGPVTHLYFTENSSWAFHSLLKEGYFTNVCANIDTDPDAVISELMLVLSHIFGRRAARVTDSEAMADAIRKSPSMVYLPPMPKAALSTLETHNANTLSIFTTYVKTFAEQHVKVAETKLPLTQFSANSPDANSTSDLSFLPSLPPPTARSPFVALSGHGDAFPTISDLCTSSRAGIFLESALIPHISLHPTETRQPLNAYLLDFFAHGSVKALEVANGIRREDVWFVLNDFSLVLGTVCAALAVYLGVVVAGRDADDEIMGVMGMGDVAENEQDEKEAEEVMGQEDARIGGPGAAVAGGPAAVPRKGKKGVAEEWGEAEDKLQEEERMEEEWEERGTDDEEYERLLKVYRAFRKLKAEFDAKFLEIWA
ncbi:hypothetical protein V502_09341 [Pseudogymnoascus sp. VKM F-4520 (FW-2644)]|nr:hypothetical protein V502_09341 [Pseudogymnoascus sp. VKM F-4520 (FW-2644)]